MSQRPKVRQLLRNAWTGYVEFHTRAPFKHHYIALIGIAAHPFYYALWKYVFPQPFEDVALRLFSMALCLVLFLSRWWPQAMKKYYLPYAYVAMMLCLPTFFTIMLLMNDTNPVWLMSTMASFLFVVLLYNVVNTIIVSVLGSVIGVLIFFAMDGVQPLPLTYIATFPIYLFTIAAILFLSYSERAIAKEKLMAAHALASNIAHEMRTPLLGIRFDCEKIQNDLSKVFEAAQFAAANHYSGSTLQPKQRDFIERALKRISDHTLAANAVIEMLLVNVAPDRISRDAFASHSIGSVIETAMDRYHFRRGERELVRIENLHDFTFFGSDLLMMHVLFNMLKNALNAVEAKGTGTISVLTRASDGESALVFHDTGAGIPSDILPFIFMPFVTGGARMQGTGIGLSFCKLVIEGFGGRISCVSDPERGTEFTITLPEVIDGRAAGSVRTLPDPVAIPIRA